MRTAILDYVRAHPGTTFVELERVLGESMCGPRALFAGPAEHNVVLWDGVSQEFIDTMLALRDGGELVARPTHYLTYLCDGNLLQLPLARRAKYKTPHWLPVAFALPGLRV
jgi:hypothetical protein